VEFVRDANHIACGGTTISIVVPSRFCALALSGCAAIASPPDRGHDLWRRDVSHLAADRALVRACLERGGECLRVVQQACVDDRETRTPAEARICDWRAMAAWEDETAAMVADLRARLTGHDLVNFNASQRAWQTSMLADVRLGMDHFEGGSAAGPEGARVRARAEAQRGEFVFTMRQLIEQ
jgi:Lysozyme inhibitor LprI